MAPCLLIPGRMRCVALSFLVVAAIAGCDRHTASRPVEPAAECEPAPNDAIATGLITIVQRVIGAIPAS